MMIKEIPGDLLQWLRGFYYVVVEGTLEKASLVMGRKQPTISRQIRCLEEELGTKLFDRSLRNMKPTAEGRTLFKQVVPFFEEVERIRSQFKEQQTEHQGTIFIVANNAIADSFLPTHISKFKKNHPNVKFHLQGIKGENIYEKVEIGEADFGISYFNSASKKLEFHTLLEVKKVLIAPKNQSFFRGKILNTNQLLKIPLILLYNKKHSISIMKKWFDENHLKPNIVLTANNILTIKNYVSQGFGASIFNEFAISEDDYKIFDIYSLDHLFPINKVCLVSRKGHYFSPASKAFIHSINPEVQFPL